MMSNYTDIRDAIQEIYDAFNREICRWYRIRRQALRRGHADLAHRILEEIHTAESQKNNLDLRNWPYGYNYLFRLDRPAVRYPF